MRKTQKILFGLIVVCSFLIPPAWAAGWKSQARKGVSDYKKGDYQSALMNFSEAAGSNPSHSTPQFNSGCAQYKMGNWEGALDDFQKSTALEKNVPQKAQGHYNAGNAFFQKGETEKAIEAYKKALLANPGDEDARHNLAVALKKKEQPPQNQQDQSSGGGGGGDEGGKSQDRNKPPPMGNQEMNALMDAFEQEEMKQAQKLRKKRQENFSVEEDW